MTADIAVFIRARLDEWEALARDARGQHWLASPSGVLSPQPGAANVQIVPAHTIMQGDAAHIATHDPASVLRQVAALRAVVERAATGVVAYSPHYESGHRDASADTLRDIASIWADHPDYAEEWAP